jgi:hypothetical protein
MKFPVISGLIRRRILVNFRVKPEVIQPLLPEPFQPKLLKGWAMAGVCLIRLEQIRPQWLPVTIGLASENAAHRIAVCWQDQDNGRQEGVYIPRRDSNTLINSLVGGRLFPGEHHRANFHVKDDGRCVELHAQGIGSNLSIDLSGKAVDNLPSTSLFSSLEEASDFYKNGSLGYSDTASGKYLDGIVLATKHWEVKPFAVENIQSSFFSDTSNFPAGSVEFDCALVMRNIEHEWHAAAEMPTHACLT